MKKHGWFGLERQRWGKLFKLSDDDLEFFELHEEATSSIPTRLARGRAFRQAVAHGDAVVDACEKNLQVWELYLNGSARQGIGWMRINKRATGF